MKALKPLSARAFTRIEFLVILTVSIFLFAVILPAFAQAKAKALRVQCLENLAEIGKAFRLFAIDHHDRYPMRVSTNEGGSADYLGTGDTGGAVDLWRHFGMLSNQLMTPRILICPADSGRYEATNWLDFEDNVRAKNAALSYGIGIESDIARPRMILAADRSFYTPNTKLAFLFNGNSVRRNIGTNLAQLERLYWDERAIHPNAGNAALADGWVQPMTSTRLRKAFFDSGDNRNNYGQPGKSSSQ